MALIGGQGVRAAIARAYDMYPQLANGATGFVTFACGDLLSQEVCGNKEKNKQIDKARILCTGMLGFGMNGLLLHNWYRSLDLVFGSSMKSKRGVIAKAMMDQLIYAPFSISAFFAYATYLDGKRTDAATFFPTFVSKMKESLFSTWLADCSFWPMVNIVNFRYIPLNYRPTFVGGAQLLWQTYLSSVSHDKHGSTKNEEEEEEEELSMRGDNDSGEICSTATDKTC